VADWEPWSSISINHRPERLEGAVCREQYSGSSFLEDYYSNWVIHDEHGLRIHANQGALRIPRCESEHVCSTPQECSVIGILETYCLVAHGLGRGRSLSRGWEGLWLRRNYVAQIRQSGLDLVRHWLDKWDSHRFLDQEVMSFLPVCLVLLSVSWRHGHSQHCSDCCAPYLFGRGSTGVGWMSSPIVDVKERPVNKG